MAETNEKPNKTPEDNKEGAENQDQQNQSSESNLDQVKIMAALAYFGILFFLPLVTHPNSSFGKFHANQGLVLLITSIAINTVGTIIPLIGWFLILPLGNLFVFVLFIMGLVNALGLKKKRLPVVGGFDIIK